VLKDNSIYIPYVPVMDAQAFHLNTAEKGTYKVLLKAGDEVIEARSIVLK
jgi:capsule polysaccharide modification protein KpsS